MTKESLSGCIYEAIPGFEDHLEAELQMQSTGDNAGTTQPTRWGALYHAAQSAALPVFWRRNVWFDPFRLEFDSISEAASALRSIHRNWAPSLFTHFRRGALIAEKLPPLPSKPRPFPWTVPDVPMGAWTLLDEHTIVAGARCSSPFPGGIIEFEEDKFGPPSRAYLKLWEALTLAGVQPGDSNALHGESPCRRPWQPGDSDAVHGESPWRPGPGSRCLDAGASPGGWTWALARLGADVCAVDRSPLDEKIAALPGVRFIKHDAFTLKPQDIGPLDWLFCDAACYPQRLLEWIEKWLASGLCKNFVCTIKMQGVIGGGIRAGGSENSQAPDFDTPRRFAAIPGSTVVHLYHNKHELTWIKLTP
jgi:23S rRNA (cytidine2498-2'-O)-methyltransferase